MSYSEKVVAKIQPGNTVEYGEGSDGIPLRAIVGFRSSFNTVELIVEVEGTRRKMEVHHERIVTDLGHIAPESDDWRPLVPFSPATMGKGRSKALVPGVR